jgi:uncharacterized membrane protein YdjX (TVP38/TMEM64 family)
LHALPVARAVRALGQWVEDFGVWAPIVYGLIYTLAVVLLIPGSVLTLAAGAIFGLVLGTITASVASTTGGALAFLISRYVARRQILAKLEQYPKFGAIDTAISESGWQIVAMLRLSPAVPFNLQNYLYGLTGIRFWTCVMTSWLAMLPGTVLYVYLGQVGRAGIEAAAGERSRSPAEWVLLAVGLAATIGVTVYVTRLARRALARHKALAGDVSSAQQVATPGPQGWPWGATLTVFVAIGAVAVAVYVQLNGPTVPNFFNNLLGAPAAQ